VLLNAKRYLSLSFVSHFKKGHRMSKSIHVTIKNFRGLTKAQLDEQFVDPSSDLNQWSKKSLVKKEAKAKRKIDKAQK